MKLALSILSVVIVLAIAIAAWMASTGKVQGFETETYKAAIQLLLVSLSAQIMTLLVTRVSHVREEVRARDAYRRDVVSRLNSIYADIKKARRLIRSRSVKNDAGGAIALAVEYYGDFMAQINDSQLALEILAKDIESSQLLHTAYKIIQEKVDSMEEYLNRIVDEFEGSIGQPVGNPPKIVYTSVPEFADLIGDYRESTFRTQFVHCYYFALDSLKKDLLFIGKNLSKKRPAK